MKVIGIEFLELWVGDANSVADLYTREHGFHAIAEAGPQTGLQGCRSIALARAGLRLVITSALQPQGPVAEHVKQYGDRVRDIALRVEGADRAVEEAVAAGARRVAPRTLAVGPSVGGFGGVVHTLIEPSAAGLTGLPSVFRTIPGVRAAVGPGLAHLSFCLELDTLDPWVEFYERIFGFSVARGEITFGPEGSRSNVVQSDGGEVSFELMEPTPGGAGQLTEFLRRNRGPGVRHAAFCTPKKRTFSLVPLSGLWTPATPKRPAVALASVSAPQVRLAGWANKVEPSVMQDMMTLTSQPGLLSLALGLPAAELFPTQALNAALTQAMGNSGRTLQYCMPSRELKRQAVELMRLRGVTCTEAQIVLTAGAQQGMSLVVRLLLDPHGSVLMESLAYPGFQQILQPYQPRVLTVPTDLETGMDVAAVRALLEGGERPALIYALSEGHNPLGVSLSAEKRRLLVQLAREFRVPIIEDDAYGLLTYRDDVPVALRALDDRWVFYVGSFSKILAPGLRAGWLVVPEELAETINKIKHASDLDTTTLAQRAVLHFLENGALGSHLSLLRKEYAHRRDAMLAALEESMPFGARWTRPDAGLFIWLDLPNEVDTSQLLAHAVQTERLAFLPEQAFWTPGGPHGRSGIRLAFSFCDAARIRDGVARLARAYEGMSVQRRAPRAARTGTR